jgi:activator of HSP90 ATPase
MQQWDFGDEEEPSEVTLLIHDHKKGTSVELRHTGIPDEAYEDIVVGWNEVYFKSLEEFYA